jgi:diguanylate cyclase (GGDEF)-like protein
MLKLILQLLLFVLFACGQASAAPLLLQPLAEGQRAEGYLSVLRDPSGQLTLTEAMGRDFQPLPGEASYGFTRDAIWLRITLQATQPGEWWLESGLTSLDDIRIFSQDAQGNWQEQRGGDHQPFAQRPEPYRLFVFPLTLNAEKPQNIYLRIRTDDSLVAPIRLWSPAAFQEWRAQENLLLGIGYGVLLAMLIYNGFLWLALRESLYGIYLLATLSLSLVVVELNGHAFQYFWPDNLWLADNQHVLLPALHFLAQSYWIRTFLDTRRRSPWADRGFLAIMAGSLVMIALSLGGYYSLGNQLAFVLSIPFITLAVFSSLRVAWTGYRPARLFLVAQLFPLLGALLTLFRALGILPDTPITEHGMHIGISIEVLLFSLALAKRIDTLRQERAEALLRAETDPLTGLFNRAGFEHRLNAELHAGQNKIALLLVDLDRFKPVNDTLGHAAGDIVLRQVAERLRLTVRTGIDLVGRQGGDEFVVALVGVRSPSQAEAVAGKIIARLEQPFETAAGNAAIGASIGIAISPQHGGDISALFAAADAAMYEAKRNGRNRHAFAPTNDPTSSDTP